MPPTTADAARSAERPETEHARASGVDVHRGFTDPDRVASRASLVTFLGAADAQQAVAAYRAQLRRALELTTGDTVLDVGCGVGTHAAALAAEHRGPVLGLDRESMLAQAVATHPTAAVRWIAGDATALGVGGGRIDAVFAERMLMYVPDAARVVAEMVRVLRPGGRIAVFELDYAGMVLGGEPSVADAVHAEVRSTVAHDRMGRRLAPMLAAAGASGVGAVTLALPIPPPLFDAAVAAPARAAVAEGRLPAREVEAWLDEQAGSGFVPVVPGVLAAGRRPADQVDEVGQADEAG